LDYLHHLLLELASKYGWNLEAWAIFSNHYHFIAQSPADSKTLKKFITHLHASSARHINLKDNVPGRKVWHEFWETQITFQRSYLARLNYVMQNPVKHKMVERASDYQWCSANWFKKHASKSYYKSVVSLNIDSVHMMDEF
jgi:putative transposase